MRLDRIYLSNFCAFWWLTLLPQAFKGRCSDYRATQKGRGWLELVISELTALGLKVKGSLGMNSTGQNNDKASYRIILLLVVGLAAFSSAMKELNQIQQLSLNASRLMAQWSGTIVPVEVPQTPAPMIVNTESCEMKQSTPSVELPWLTHVAQAETSEIEETEAPVIVKRSSMKVKKARRVELDPVQLEVRIPSVHEADDDADETIVSEFPVTSFSVAPFPTTPFKAKARKHGSIIINPRDREMLLKTFNRSINLRIAG